MQNQLKVVSISYKTAPLALREALALSEQEAQMLLGQLKEYMGVQEALVLSTCNRTEIYYVSEQDQSTDLIKILGILKGQEDTAQYQGLFKVIQCPHQALQHLFYVAMGLESQVVGDMQISNQVKTAYQWSADMQMAGPFLHRLMHTIFFTNKKVVQETSYRDGAASTSYAAVELLSTLVAELPQPKILVLGLGEIGTDVCKNLVGKGFEQVAITNRTFSKAEALAAECGFEARPFEEVWTLIAEADVIISSVALPEPFINKQKVESLSTLSFKYFIDLSVPRSVAPEVEEVPGMIVYNIDHLQMKANEALQKRLAAVPQVQELISESMREFKEWSKEMNLSPTIQKFKNALEQIRKEEMARYLKEMNPEAAEIVDKVTKSMMQKIVKFPAVQLKAACKRGDADNLIEALHEIFNLEQAKESL